ncbi:MAG TPA: hypothetical protein VGS41_03485, partial [Chthonomonadales bacterium]|nr:hypothetical protein [Chthonomonadales bacterium]
AWSDEKPDRDLVLTIADSNRKGAPTMLVEFPDLTMVGAFSKWRERIGAARTAASAAIRRLGRSHHPFRATITGVGFFDYRHNQPGSAPNGFELHPVLSFHAAAGDPAALSRDPGSKRHAAPAS